MIVRFNNDYLEKLYLGLQVKGKPRFSEVIILKYKKAVLLLKNVEDVLQLRQFSGLNFEALTGNLQEYYSVRVDYRDRLILSVSHDQVLAKDILTVEDLTNHYQ